ncbi:XrtA/PEP-CTERM system histidine kinase PrsK [Trichlorobacter ammonificans]|uniref:histidine kinase n=1 Tax=Trichlorobacter ammonificans TaxID=2916410 RepID=A0ABN8HJB5_9BACT|nr:XrtA/PEP-CTERM system histidine kinase PrsK [Trichlorobacter ammonificans]CAH2031413.1 Sensory transduction histidine kinases [Trichlorobacter ammonificans]
MLQIVAISAITGGLAFLLALVLRREQGASTPYPLAAAIAVVLALELFDLLALTWPGQMYLWKKCALVTEGLLPPAWLLYSLTCGREERLRALPLRARLVPLLALALPAWALLLPIRSFIYSPDFAVEQILFLGQAGFSFYLVLLMALVVALVNLELTLVHTPPALRWRMKFELLGAGVLLAVLIVYYSQAFIFRALDMQVTTTRALVLLAAMALIAYSRFRRGSGGTVQVSPQLAYKSVVLLAVGLYVTGLGIAGEGMRYVGGGFQRSLFLAMLLLAGLGLLAIFLSEAVRRRIRICIQKNFYRNKYDYRHQWLGFTERLSAATSSDELLRAIVCGFCDTFGMGSGVLFVLNQERDAYQHGAGGGETECGLSFDAGDPLIRSLAESRWILDLRDNVTELDRSCYRGYFEEQGACFLVPLSRQGDLDGFILLGRQLNPEELYTYEDFDLMRTLAGQASFALLNLRLSEQLACSRELAAIGKVAGFVVHDLKNLVSAVSLSLENARQYIALPEFQQELLTTLGSTVERMQGLISRLRPLPERENLRRTPVDLLQVAHETVALLKQPCLRVTGTTAIASGDREELQKVALNLVMNAMEATGDGKPVTVEVGEQETPYFRVTDEGCGIPEAYLRQRLFRPFSSTKQHGLGIGLYQSKQIVEAHGGTIEVTSNGGCGTEFTVRLPKMQPDSLWQEADYGKAAHC